MKSDIHCIAGTIVRVSIFTAEPLCFKTKRAVKYFSRTLYTGTCTYLIVSKEFHDFKKLSIVFNTNRGLKFSMILLKTKHQNVAYENLFIIATETFVNILRIA